MKSDIKKNGQIINTLPELDNEDFSDDLCSIYEEYPDELWQMNYEKATLFIVDLLVDLGQKKSLTDLQIDILNVLNDDQEWMKLGPDVLGLDTTDLDELDVDVKEVLGKTAINNNRINNDSLRKDFIDILHFNQASLNLSDKCKRQLINKIKRIKIRDVSNQELLEKMINVIQDYRIVDRNIRSTVFWQMRTKQVVATVLLQNISDYFNYLERDNKAYVSFAKISQARTDNSDLERLLYFKDMVQELKKLENYFLKLIQELPKKSKKIRLKREEQIVNYYKFVFWVMALAGASEREVYERIVADNAEYIVNSEGQLDLEKNPKIFLFDLDNEKFLLKGLAEAYQCVEKEMNFPAEKKIINVLGLEKTTLANYHADYFYFWNLPRTTRYRLLHRYSEKRSKYLKRIQQENEKKGNEVQKYLDQGLKQAEIAKKLNVSTKTIQRRVYKIKHGKRAK